ncbi:hypothetical protein L917_13979 [Phytophthora nicotianae]|uniref:Reverse transcriptase RNase H-like domain-containing protein n=1 Tax=Phytophthora nicotianae TaxID=4792 RepID=W2KNI5_PHYNI|nr:hypothetical protein L917_13979 [Phytophthora nicotianae]
MQDFRHGWQPVAYASKVNSGEESNYSITELECLAVVWSVKLFRPYLYGRTFSIITDHAALKWLMTRANLAGRLHRWSLTLQEYDFGIEYCPGSTNVVANALSRAPAAVKAVVRPREGRAIPRANNGGARTNSAVRIPVAEANPASTTTNTGTVAMMEGGTATAVALGEAAMTTPALSTAVPAADPTTETNDWTVVAGDAATLVPNLEIPAAATSHTAGRAVTGGLTAAASAPEITMAVTDGMMVAGVTDSTATMAPTGVTTQADADPETATPAASRMAATEDRVTTGATGDAAVETVMATDQTPKRRARRTKKTAGSAIRRSARLREQEQKRVRFMDEQEPTVVVASTTSGDALVVDDLVVPATTGRTSGE